MKKNLKRGLILLLVLVQLFVLCGCNALDELRENQAFYDEDGNILWADTTYKKLPACEYLNPDIDYSRDIYVTEPDVPVLLSDLFYQEALSPSTDGNFLTSNNYGYYCREELYDSFSARIQEPFVPDIVCYSYDVYDEDTFEFETRYYTLTQEQVDAIELVIEQVEPTVMGEGWSLEHDWMLPLEECSKDMLLRRYSLDIAKSGNQYYLFLSASGEELIFSVPDGCNAVFDEIVSTYLSMGDTYLGSEYTDI